MAVKTTTLQSGKIGIIDVKGSLVGGEETDELRNAVADFVEQGTKKLIIDLWKVTYLNSTAIGVLVSAHTTFSKNNGHVKAVRHQQEHQQHFCHHQAHAGLRRCGDP